MKKETFQLEITLENGQITNITSPDKSINIIENVPTLEKLPDSIKKKISYSMQHGSMILMGQNSPGWILVKTLTGYTWIESE